MKLETLFTEDQIQTRIDDLAEEIEANRAGEPIIVLGVLKGAMHFVSDLARRLKGDVKIDFIQPSSYSGTKSMGIVHLRKDHDLNITGQHVLIVEDIVDTGLTLTHLLELLGTRKPASIRVATLLMKPDAMTHQAPVDYIGFVIPNLFVVGYGLDHDEQYRGLPYVAVLQPEETSSEA